jgi:hypothetical protein
MHANRFFESDENPEESKQGLETLRDIAASLLPENLKESVRKVPTGFCVTKVPNILAARAPSGKPVIFVDISFLSFPLMLNVMSREDAFGVDTDETLTVECLPDAPIRIDRAVDSGERRSLFLTTIGLNFLFTGFPQLAYEQMQIPLFNEDDRLRQTLTRTQHIFAYLHEIGHIVKGHLDNDRVEPVPLRFGDSNLNVYRRRRTHETEADEFACQYLLTSESSVKITGAERDVIHFAVDMLFTYFSLIEDIHDYIVSSAGLPRSERAHPRARERIAHLRSLFPYPDHDLQEKSDEILRVFDGALSYFRGFWNAHKKYLLATWELDSMKRPNI